MLLNKTHFNIYSSDTENSIIERISSFFNSTPFWIHINFNDDKNSVTESQDINVINILDDLKKNIIDEVFSSFKDLEANYQFWINDKTNSELDPVNELAKLYVIFYSENKPVDFMLKISLEDFFSEIGGTDYDWENIENILNKRDYYINKLSSEIRDLKKKTSVLEEEMKKINIELDQPVDIVISDFQVESIVTTLNIETENPVLLKKILNSLNEDNILFCKLDNYFKIFEKNKNVFEKYDYDSEHLDNELVVVFFEIIHRKYIFKEIKILAKSEYLFEINVDVSTLEQKVNIEQLKNILETDFKLLSETNTKIKGNFILNENNFHKELFLDEIMNNEKFFNMYTNERNKLGKGVMKLNLYFYSIDTGTVSFSIANKTKNTIVCVKKSDSIEKAEKFKNIFLHLFKTYKTREKFLFNYYKKFIPSISLTVKEQLLDEDKENFLQKKSKNILAQKEPTLFIPLYTRKCAKPPRIIEETDDAGDFNTMLFPIFNEGGLKPRKYICDSTGNFKFPGLRKNTLINKDVFKYIPCCYETDQELRKGSLWNTYFKGNTDKNEKYQHILYKTSRILPNENSGVLPENITKLLGQDKYRKGVFIGPNSAIDCISRITHKNSKDINDEVSRIETLKEIRRNLSWELCLQDNSDIEKQDLKNWFYNNSLYFDPRRFYRALEKYFSINIYFFEKNTDHSVGINNNKITFKRTVSNGCMVLPNIPDIGIYLDSKKYRESAVVYIHMGGAIDSLEFPHCEYIPNNKELNVFTFNNVYLEKVYRNLLLNYKSNFNYNRKDFKSQILDSTGRVRFLRDNNDILIKLENPNLSFDNINIEELEFPNKDSLNFYIKMKRLARVFLEYCIVKYSKTSSLNLDDFFKNHTEINTSFKYSEISPNFKLEYFDRIFSENNKIIFESQDTKDRIYYSMKKLEKINNGFEQKKPYIYSYFQDNLDFEGFVVNETTFKEFAYGFKQGKTFNNFIEELNNNEDLIIVKNKVFLDLNGYFGVFSNIEDLKKNLLKLHCNQKEDLDTYYIWDEDQYKKYYSKGNGLIILLYKINSIVYYLGKYSSL